MNKIKGLTNEEVLKRIKLGKVNYDTTPKSKSVKQIIIENTCTLFNFINIVLALAIILVGSYKNLLFLGVVICNTLISTIQELRAKKTVDKLSVISSSKAKVLRDENIEEISTNEIVLDDVIIYELGDQIITDAKVLNGTCEVNESFITGEAKTITKKENDILLSGSFIVSGKVYSKVIHVGLENYTSLISHDAKKLNKIINSEIVRALNKIVKYVSIALIPIGLLLLLRQFNIDGNTTQNAVVNTVAAVIGMIPEGLILLVSTVLAISVVKLSKYNVLVQDLYAIETLARVDTLCLDKTGTITEGIMEVTDVIPLNNNSINEIDIIMEALSTNLEDKNPTFKAINDKYKNTSSMKAKEIIAFSSDKKYSGAVFNNICYFIGAPEILLKENFKKYEKQIDELSSDNRVLILVSSKNKKIDNPNPIALILIRDKIRDDAIKTLEYFMDNSVELKVISGDNTKTVCGIAKRAGIDIKGSVDARTINNETDINELVEKNNIFGRVKPEQKKLIIKALKENGHIVAMTGDGVNDVLALKEADCGIAMNDGTDAARNVSEFVLLDSKFSSMPEVIKEGRKTINNVQRSATLFLSKTIYASLLALLFLFINYSYPFMPIQMSLISSLTIGLPAFILALEPNHDRVNGKFLINVIGKAIPSGITTVINILLLVLLANLFKITNDQTSTIAVLVTGYTAILLIYRISKPLNLLRKSLLVLLITLFSLAYIATIGRLIYSLEILKPTSVLILVFLMYVSTRLFVILSNALNIIVRKHNKWFI